MTELNVQEMKTINGGGKVASCYINSYWDAIEGASVGLAFTKNPLVAAGMGLANEVRNLKKNCG